MMDRRDVGVAVLCGVIFAMIWSFSFVVSHDSVKGLPPILLVGARLFLAGLLLWIVLRGKVNSFWKGLSRGERGIVLVSGFLSQGVYLGLNFGSLLTLPTSIANIVVSSVPMLMIPVAFVVLGERVRFLNVVAVVVGMVGVVVTLGGGEEVSWSYHAVGIVFLLLSAVSLAMGNVLIKKVISRENFLSVCSVQFLVSGVVLLPVGFVWEEVPSVVEMVLYIPNFLFMIFVASILGTWCWFRALDSFTANGASTFFLLTPLMGIGMGFFLVSESATWEKWWGGGLVTISILIKTAPSLWRMVFDGNKERREG